MLVVALAVLLLQSTTALPCDDRTVDTQTVQDIRESVKPDALPAGRLSSSATEQRSGKAQLQTENHLADPQRGLTGDAPISPIIRAASPPSSAPPPVVIAPSGSEQKRHRFMDRTNLIGFGVHAAVRITDATQSCVLLGRPGRKEAWLPMKSCGGIAAYSLSMVPAQVTSSYLFHRTGHHKLERWLPYMWAAPSAVGVGVSVRSW